jgi:hypothetical protein
MKSYHSESAESTAARNKSRVENCTKAIVERFERGDLPAPLAPVFIRRKDDMPCRKWSWRNQLLTALAGYDDARTYLEWQKLGRFVKAGEHAFYILEPCRYSVKQKDTDTGEEKDVSILKGFKGGARFGYEQTDGKALPGREHERAFIDGLPLVSVAFSWGLRVGTFNGADGGAQGWFKHNGEHGVAIALGVENRSTWAHELVHAADLRNGKLVTKGERQELSNEVVAELGGATLLACLGYESEADLGGCFNYIKAYCDRNEAKPERVCMQLLDRICEAVALILDTAETLASAPAAQVGAA